MHDRWLVRRLPALITDAGLEVTGSGSFSYVETTDPAYMLTLVDRGADLLAADGCIGGETAGALKAEARRRVETGRFFGHIAYGVVFAAK